MRSYFVWTVGLAGVVLLTARCGGATDTLGNASADASVDATKEGGGSSSSSGGSSGSSGGGSGSSTSGSGGSSGSGSSGGSSSGTGSGSSGGSSSGSNSGSSSGSSSGGSVDGGDCTVACTNGQTCCGSECVDTYDDPHNCGGCGNRCPDKKPTCGGGTCEVPPCDNQGGNCASTTTCCGTDCCTSGQLCCLIEGPVQQQPRCVTPTAQQPTCPVGCPVCP